VAQVSPVSLLTGDDEALVRPGDYYSTERDLFYVERVYGDFALLEDCRDGSAIEVSIDEVLLMSQVRRASSSAS
jgi:hypothetical protein